MTSARYNLVEAGLISDARNVDFLSYLWFEPHEQATLHQIPNLRPCSGVQNKESFEFYATEHFRMSGVYWGLSALHLIGRADLLDREDVLDWVLRCQKPSGGFGGAEAHDAHMLYTLSAVQILALYDRLDLLDVPLVTSCEWGVRLGEGGSGTAVWRHRAPAKDSALSCNIAQMVLVAHNGHTTRYSPIIPAGFV